MSPATGSSASPPDALSARGHALTRHAAEWGQRYPLGSEQVRVRDVYAVAAHLDMLGVPFVRPVEEFPPGLIATVADCDGNYVREASAA